MLLILNCVGTLKNGPERDLVLRYIKRAAVAGKSLGISGVEIHEVRESRAKDPSDRKLDEAKLLRTLIHGQTETVCFDQHGTLLTSVMFAELILETVDRSASRLDFLIGGPDGLDAGILAEGFLRVSFGAMTWPHQLARIMAAEQIYRAITIMNRHPYHRG